MNNRERYKSAMSGVHHSNDAIERIFDMTVDKKSSRKNTFKRLASATLALAILVGSGFGVNQIVNDKIKQDDTKPNIVQSESNPLTVMVAYAGELETPKEFEMKAGSENKQQLFYSLHFADINDEKALAKLEEIFEKDKSTVSSSAQGVSDEGYSTTIITSSGAFCDANEKVTVKYHAVKGGSIALSLDDYTDVKSFCVKNNSEYGQLYLNYKVDGKTKSNFGNNLSISGDDLRNSQDSKIFECGTIHKVNKGYELHWDYTQELYNEIGNNPDFDLTQVKDTITFTVEFNDGTTQSASLNLYFDSNGYMHFEG